MVGIFFTLALIVLIIVLSFEPKRALIISAVASIVVMAPVWFVSNVVYPADCVQPDVATPTQQAAGQVCSPVQMRIHGVSD